MQHRLTSLLVEFLAVPLVAYRRLFVSVPLIRVHSRQFAARLSSAFSAIPSGFKFRITAAWSQPWLP